MASVGAIFVRAAASRRRDRNIVCAGITWSASGGNRGTRCEVSPLGGRPIPIPVADRAPPSARPVPAHARPSAAVQRSRQRIRQGVIKKQASTSRDGGENQTRNNQETIEHIERRRRFIVTCTPGAVVTRSNVPVRWNVGGTTASETVEGYKLEVFSIVRAPGWLFARRGAPRAVLIWCALRTAGAVHRANPLRTPLTSRHVDNIPRKCGGN